ncbi:MAG: hypothetical protein K0Q50_133 [Vampirovibrio sp.]|jgi:hypothetical protein|nr:hypothetical protein [Vampirovibrio sp.]
MTDFTGFNPDKNLGANFNANRQGKGSKPDANADNQPQATPPGDPYASLKMDPERMMNLLSAQARFNIPSNIENPGIEKSMFAFTQAVSPERHARVTRLMNQAYTTEFGTPPNPETLQTMVDDYLIGQVVIQQA